jgi:hypothetical protein
VPHVCKLLFIQQWCGIDWGLCVQRTFHSREQLCYSFAAAAAAAVPEPSSGGAGAPKWLSSRQELLLLQEMGQLMARWQQYVMDRLLRAALPALLQVRAGEAWGPGCRHSVLCAMPESSGAATHLLASACSIDCALTASAWGFAMLHHNHILLSSIPAPSDY